MNVLAIGCHPDDVEIACAGTLSKCVKRGDRVIVCHASTGNLGHVIIPPDELTLIRAEEAKKAGKLAGIEVISAGFNDLDDPYIAKTLTVDDWQENDHSGDLPQLQNYFCTMFYEKIPWKPAKK